MKHWDAFKAGEAAYVDTEGDLRAAIDAACTVAYAEGRKDQAEPAEMDRWECAGCGGHGEVERMRKVTHQLGTDELPFWEECETCKGLGWCGPDADVGVPVGWRVSFNDGKSWTIWDHDPERDQSGHEKIVQPLYRRL